VDLPLTQARISWGTHGLPKVSPGPAMSDHSSLRAATPETAMRLFQGQGWLPTGRVTCGPLRYPMPYGSAPPAADVGLAPLDFLSATDIAIVETEGAQQPEALAPAPSLPPSDPSSDLAKNLSGTEVPRVFRRMQAPL
jgi:hypothetical protein